LISSRICAWIVTSSAVVGSSAMISFGLQLSAIAIITRCRMPPLKWCAYCFRRRFGSAIPTKRKRWVARSPAEALDRPRCRRMPSTSCVPMVSTGLSEVIGS
jgi:hypothetical protein